MEHLDKDHVLYDSTVLIVSPDASPELVSGLKRFGARPLIFPTAAIHAAESSAALDEAIENLFGYDWIIFTNIYAVDYFLRRFYGLNHEAGELDTLRVCALDEVTQAGLEKARVHVDLVPTTRLPAQALESLQAYMADLLQTSNILIPGSIGSMNPLVGLLEAAGARVDLVCAYAVGSEEAAAGSMRAMVLGGGVDYLLFTSAASVAALAQMFDTTDLSQLFAETIVFCCDEAAAQAAHEFGLFDVKRPPDPSADSLVEAVCLFHEAPAADLWK